MTWKSTIQPTMEMKQWITNEHSALPKISCVQNKLKVVRFFLANRAVFILLSKTYTIHNSALESELLKPHRHINRPSPSNTTLKV